MRSALTMGLWSEVLTSGTLRSMLWVSRPAHGGMQHDIVDIWDDIGMCAGDTDDAEHIMRGCC